MATRRALTAQRDLASPPPLQLVRLAKVVGRVPEGNRWVHELKFARHRYPVSVGGVYAHAFIRSGPDWSDKSAPVAEDAVRLSPGQPIDGEAVVVDAAG